MTNEKNYWLFRVSNKWGNRTRKCLGENMVYCGWNVKLSDRKREDILRDYPWASKMAIRFTYIEDNDIIIMPLSGGIAIGEAGNKEFRDDLDWKDTLKVKWLTKFYSRKNLSSNLQSSLKYRGTFLNLNRYAEEIGRLIEGKFLGQLDNYNQEKQKLQEEAIESISRHLSERKLIFQDKEFESFVMHLLELNYPSLTGVMNNQIQEAKDGKDLTMGLDFDDFDVNIKFNIQVKQHHGDENPSVLNQISKSDDEDCYTKNVVVTTANIEKLREEAKKSDIILFGARELAGMIVDNFENIEEQYQAKLNLLSLIKPIEVT